MRDSLRDDITPSSAVITDGIVGGRGVEVEEPTNDIHHFSFDGCPRLRLRFSFVSSYSRKYARLDVPNGFKR